MALSSSSTIDDAVAQYRDSCGWQGSGSVSTARDFAEACRWLTQASPTGVSAKGISVSGGDLTAQLERVDAWLEANAPTRRGVTRVRPSPRFRG